MENLKKLVLEDGSSFTGNGFGYDCERVCELVFNTSMVGYQEIMSDPAYTDQAVLMTYPLIGNYGVTDEDFETKTPTLGALIVREYNDIPSNFRYTRTLSEVMEEYHIPGLWGIDTRKLARNIRDLGSRRAIITDTEVSTEEAVKKIFETPVPHDAVLRVSSKKRWYSKTASAKYNVVLIDFLLRLSTLHALNARGCNITVVPHDISAADVINMRPDGVFISSGPGDPADAFIVTKLIGELKGKYPIFGIGLGHQLIALAYGAKINKLKFGHRGANHPIKNLQTGKIEMAAQNHSYVVDLKSLDNTPLKATHVDVLDSTVEGIECINDGVFSVQYYPESASGAYLYDKFITNMKEAK